MTATPDAAYSFGSWIVLEDDMETVVSVTDNQFSMPACEVYVSATFNSKPIYEITSVASPVAGGTILTDENAYEGKTVTVTCEANSGYELSSIVITKTSDGSATDITPIASGDDYVFTMPGYAITVTATFESVLFEGSFVKYSGSLTEGDYIIVYNNQAMNNTLTNNKLGYISVKDDISENTITDPKRSIVWHIAPSSTNGYWTIYNAKESKYVCGTASNTNLSLVDSPLNNNQVNNGAIWGVSGSYDFRCKANEGQTTARYIRNNSGSYGNYSAQNGGVLTLYMLAVDSSPVWSSLPNSQTGKVGTEYTLNLQNYVSGYPAPTISVKATNVDPMLSYIKDGTFHFTPNVAGETTFTFKAENTQGSSEVELTISVNSADPVDVPVISVNESSVTSNLALVSWTTCTDASAYTLELFTSIIDESFENNEVPTGWTANSISFDSGKGGDGTYCATFNSSSDYIITPAVTNPGSISFKYKRSSNSTAWGLDISYASAPDASEWNNIGSVSSASESWKTFSATINNVSGTVYIRIKDTRSTGSHARYVDHIQVAGAATSTVVYGTSYTFKELVPETTYATRVQKKDADNWSDWATFTTEAETPETKNLTINVGAYYNGRYWTSFYDGENSYKLPTGAQAFRLDNNKLYLVGDSGVVIPKETAVVIISDKASLTLTQTNAKVTVGDNDLVGSDTNVIITDGKVGGKIPHVLSIQGSPSAIGFYKFSGSTIPAGKAYYLVSE